MSEDLISKIPTSRRLVLDLGMGDGQLVANLSNKEKDSFHIGIEINPDRFIQASSSIKNQNVHLINDNFEKILPLFKDNSISQVFYILPDPKYIDKNHKPDLERFYKLLYNKIKKHGTFILITEITNELFQPVENKVLNDEISWITNFFESLGYVTLECHEGYPEEYTTSFLRTFSGDLERIRILYFEFIKTNK
ncbi:MAG: methyltransferase domain-containing protein [Nitrososphaeraceae archaeon]|nr:methyltransferase domain-containing protein [Nitrososphaeraceae archaeon]